MKRDTENNIKKLMNLKFGVRKILINLTNMQLDLPRTIKERQNTKNKKKHKQMIL